ncbi:MAG: 23S rRNA (pseudouridine(1915)-N(3))-methyltransferase RlmH [Oscillospiraceae bacterium]|nr:23S rRNA (pseudouridine(1915)-N(3))-methyltransferase RlmH [Oscillospiraceae bacterium]
MLTIELLCVGKMSQKWFSDGFDEYRKRIGAFDRLTVTEISEYRVTDDSDSSREEAVRREGEVLLRHLKGQDRAVKVALCVEGKIFSSEELAELLSETKKESSKIIFVIGGSGGLSDSVKKECHVKLSMGRMTFTHQMARMILAEQLYRAESINSGMKYHK